MAASDSALLLLGAGQARRRILRIVEVAPDTFVFPLHWLIFGRLHNVEVLNSSFHLSHVEKTKVIGVPSARELGAPAFAYVLLLALGWITLSTPIAVRLVPSATTLLSLDASKEYVSQVVRQSNLDSAQIDRVVRKVQHAKSVKDMARMIAENA